MQVVILCGGKGVRIREVSEELPKPMLPIGNRPIVWHIMQHYASYGFNDFVLCLGYKSWKIKEFFLNYQYLYSDYRVRLGSGNAAEVSNKRTAENWQVTLAETGLDTMTGGRLKQVEPYLKGEHFMLTYGDGLSDINLQTLLQHHHQQGRIGTVTAVQPPSRFGELKIQEGLVTDFHEKPPVTTGRINGGFFVFRREFLDRLPTDSSLVLEQAPLRDLASEGELMAYGHDGFWQCMDNSRDFQYLNDLWSSGSAPWVSTESHETKQAA